MTGPRLYPFVLASLATLLSVPAPARAGGPITSNQVVGGYFGTPAYAESWTFAGNAGERVVMTAVSGVALANTVVTLRRPDGVAVATSNGADRLEFQLAATGTWTVEVSEQGHNYPGVYDLSLVNLGSGPLVDAGDPDGASIASAENRSGAMQQVADLDAWTFTADAGDRVLVNAVSQTAGFDTRVTLYPPGGGAPIAATTSDRLDATLAQAGTWTVLVEDEGNDVAGAYRLSIFLLPDGPFTSGTDTDGGALVPGVRRTGASQPAGDSDAFTWDALAGRPYLVELGSLSFGDYQPVGTRFDPGGAPAPVSGLFSVATPGVPGTAALVVEDSGLDDTGTYSLRVVDLVDVATPTVEDPDAGAIASAEVRAGQLQDASDVDGYTFTALAGERLRIQLLLAAGDGPDRLTLVGPGGVVGYSHNGGLDLAAPSSGAYTIVIDNQLGFAATWSYELSLLNVTSGPYERPGETDGGAIASGGFRLGTIDAARDADVYQFNAAGGDRLALRTVPVGGGLNPWLGLYRPGGGAAISGGTADRVDVTLDATGTWTLVVENAGTGPLGDYRLELINLTSGPLASGLDPDGGAIGSNVVREGEGGPAGDLDAYTLTAGAGERLLFVVEPHGVPSGAGVIQLVGPVSSYVVAGPRLEVKLTQSGTFHLLIESAAATGGDGYSLGFVNLTAGPFDGAGDTGGPIGDGTVYAGAIAARAELDAYRFSAPQFETVILDAVAIGGSLDTKVTIYPPTGGPAAYSGTADHVEFQVLSAGTYTLLVEDATRSGTGEYRLSFEGGAAPVAVEEPAIARLALAAPYPNPSSGPARIACAIPAAGHVRLRVYDARGALVRTLADGRFEAGRAGVSWDGRDDRGDLVAAGLYFVELRAGGETLRRKLVRME